MQTEPVSVLATSGDYHLNITSESAQIFREALKGFLQETEGNLVALIERSGAVIVSEENRANNVKMPRADTLGVLVAGLYSATQMMAGQLGEASTPEVFCHGPTLNIYLTPVSEEFALYSVFREGVAVGVIRLHARRVAKAILNDLGAIVSNRTTLAATAGNGERVSVSGPFSRYH